MFTQLHLQNFKGWADTGPLRLAPITVLFGSNSSGKTSLLQSILLLKQTAESSDRSRVLHTGDDKTLVDVGTVSDVIFGHDLSGTLEITLAWRLPEPLEIPGERPDEIRFTLQVRLTSERQPFVQLARYHMDRAYVVLERRADDTGYDLKSLPHLKRTQGRAWALPPPVRFYGFPDEVRNYFQKADWLADLALELERQLARVHCEHFLRRLQRRVAEETITKDHVALYVCDVVDGRSRIDSLGVDELGNITNWPKDFFGDEIGDLAAMTEAAMKRRKKS